ncbi:MAG: 3-oxoacyl-[acyl-carrier-protein] reductase [Candidatus Sericytochromatia bacterium]|nr:3-oxoacyl-[acyl-carrier-protein] reductase [Candidatus Sericytochromatia bacterium]
MNQEQPVALVTGAGRGIGKAVALAFAEAGYTVAVNYGRSAEAAAEVVGAIVAGGGVARAFGADVADPAQVDSLFTEVLAWSGQRLDVLVNNAGITRDGLALRLTNEAWDEVIDTNLKGAFLCARSAVKPMMKRRSGCILNMSSVVGLDGQAGQANYAASKAGLVGLTMALAKELGSRNIRVNAIAPGFIVSDMTEALDQAVRDALLQRLPLSRFGDPAEVADLCVFLATRAPYVTGQVIRVDGGLHL